MPLLFYKNQLSHLILFISRQSSGALQSQSISNVWVNKFTFTRELQGRTGFIYNIYILDE
jgi:hypothetical protein